jgi:hypothetical protein
MRYQLLGDYTFVMHTIALRGQYNRAGMAGHGDTDTCYRSCSMHDLLYHADHASCQAHSVITLKNCANSHDHRRTMLAVTKNRGCMLKHHKQCNGAEAAKLTMMGMRPQRARLISSFTSF